MNTSKTLLVAAGLFGLCSHVAAPADLKKDLIYESGLMSKYEYVYQENPRFLNKDIPDKYSFNKATIELKNHFVAGREQFGHDAVEGLVVLRHKSVMGQAGKTDIADEQSIKVGDAFIGQHTHNSTKPVVWVKEAWLKATLNSIFGFSSDDVHSVKVGQIAHEVGRGIALGSEYGSPKDFLAAYSKSNDFCAPGIVLSGDVLKKGLSYAAYVGFLENKSSTVRDTFNVVKSNQIGREATPWSGTGNDNTMYSFALTARPIDTELLSVLVTPYIVYNRDLDEMVDAPRDSESNLITLGANFNIQQEKNWGIDCEAAMNFGSEKLYNIDRNQISALKSLSPSDPSNGGENLKQVYSHIQQYVGGSYVAAPAYNELQAELASNRHLTNGEVFNVTVDGFSTQFRSAPNRIRPAYENTYAGFMGVIDSYYNIEKLNLVFSNAFGYVTGGSNPHAVEANKVYRGFIAMHEFYTGKYVKSAYMLDSRNVKRPLSFEQGDTSLEDNSFTDMIFGGYGFTWRPDKYRAKRLVVNTNGLAFWKELPSYKVDPTTGVPSSTEFARTFMGTELNLIASMELVPNMTLAFKGAVFFPGSYYADIKGVRLSGDLYSKLNAADTLNLDAAKYRLSTDTSYVANVSLDYRF